MKKALITLLTATLLTMGCSDQKPIELIASSIKIASNSQEEIYVGFKEGDHILFDFNAQQDTIESIEILEYPNHAKFKSFDTNRIENKTLNVNQTGIYCFRFRNASEESQTCQFKVQRVPGKWSFTAFDSKVHWREVRDTTYTSEEEDFLIKDEISPKIVINSQEFYINSGSNATFKGGKSRITIPVTLPENTIAWYYEFSASRNKADVHQASANFDLAGEIMQLMDQTGILNFTVNALTQPPGADICDIYLLDYDNSLSFKSKLSFKTFPVGNRSNIKSGIVEMQWVPDTTVYIGIRNPDSMHGIHLALEVVAIVREQEWETRTLQIPQVNSRKEPYLKN